MFSLLLKISTAIEISSILLPTKESFFKKKNQNRDKYEVPHGKHACYRGYI